MALASVILADIAICALNVGAEHTAKLHSCTLLPSLSRPEGIWQCFEVAALPTHAYADAAASPYAIGSSQ